VTARSCAHLWEFPGGKLEPGETLEGCVVRGCREELEIDISVNGILDETSYWYQEREVELTFFEAELLSGEIKRRYMKKFDGYCRLN
jgi:8-oxo-dGTP diphosphatase